MGVHKVVDVQPIRSHGRWARQSSEEAATIEGADEAREEGSFLGAVDERSAKDAAEYGVTSVRMKIKD